MLRAAEQGHAEAQYNAGIMLLHGEGGLAPDPARGEVNQSISHCNTSSLLAGVVVDNRLTPIVACF